MTEEVLHYIKHNKLEFVHFEFTDLFGTTRRLTWDAEAISLNSLKEGFSFDGSSMQGWQPIEASDMVILPDCQRFYIDPFAAYPSLIIKCNIFDPHKQDFYQKDPRSIAIKAMEYLKTLENYGTAYFGPELEFFVFDHLDCNKGMETRMAGLYSAECAGSLSPLPYSLASGHQALPKKAYLATPPNDSLSDIRAEMLKILKQVGLKALFHHHEVATAQCEIIFAYDELLATADNIQLFKYVIKNVAASFGKTASFMPKPLAEDNGSGMHVHTSLKYAQEELFAGEEYSKLSKLALYYIGGILKHAKALNAFTNPTTNSYKRLAPGFEAPTQLAYAAYNRSAAIRIPYTGSKRIEMRFPDPSANPYLALSAILMAGLDGMLNKIEPGKPMETNLYTNTKLNIPQVSTSLREALSALETDYDFLLRGNVFSEDLIESYISCKLKEACKIEQIPHPEEFKLYYSV